MSRLPSGNDCLEAAHPHADKAKLRLQALFAAAVDLPAHCQALAEALSDQEATTLGADTLADLVDAICGDDDDARLVLAGCIAVLYGPESLDGSL